MPIRRTRLAAAAATTTLLLAGGLLAGCGSSGDSAGTAAADTAAQASTAAELTLADYQAQATDICTTANDAEAQLAKPTTSDEFLTYLDEQTGIGTTYVAGLEGIAPPADHAEDHAALVNAGKLNLALIDDAKTAINSGKTVDETIALIANGEGVQAAKAAQDTAATALDVPACSTDA